MVINKENKMKCKIFLINKGDTSEFDLDKVSQNISKFLEEEIEEPLDIIKLLQTSSPTQTYLTILYNPKKNL